MSCGIRVKAKSTREGIFKGCAEASILITTCQPSRRRNLILLVNTESEQMRVRWWKHVAQRAELVSHRSHLLGAVGAVDVFRFDDKALVGQRQRALLTVEAVLVPAVALVVHHVGALAEPCRGGWECNNYTHVVKLTL